VHQIFINCSCFCPPKRGDLVGGPSLPMLGEFAGAFTGGYRPLVPWANMINRPVLPTANICTYKNNWHSDTTTTNVSEEKF
jgi:hypothetical protein